MSEAEGPHPAGAGSRAPAMRIVDVRHTVVGNSWKNWVFVHVVTDQGLEGVGEATGGLHAEPQVAALRELRPLVIGEDPRQVGALWDLMYKGLYLSHDAAMAGIEIACWDILGQALGVPVWQLLGGQVRPRVRAYANGWYRGPRDPAFLKEAAASVVARGYGALKFDPFGSAYRFLDRSELARSIALVEAVRHAVGDDVDLLIEGHDRFSVGTAIEVGSALADYRPFWFETPVMSTDPSALAEVGRRVPVRIVAGERQGRLSEFVALLATGVLDVVQPEILRCGGISGIRKVAALAEAYEAFLAPHNAQSPLTTVINTHVGATIPNLLIQECFDDFLEPWCREVVRGAVKIEGGYLAVPEGPGLGVTIDEVEARRHPYGERNFLRLFQPGWELRRPES